MNIFRVNKQSQKTSTIKKQSFLENHKRLGFLQFVKLTIREEDGMFAGGLALFQTEFNEYAIHFLNVYRMCDWFRKHNILTIEQILNSCPKERKKELFEYLKETEVARFGRRARYKLDKQKEELQKYADSRQKSLQHKHRRSNKVPSRQRKN
jgi:hypothetical protein